MSVREMRRGSVASSIESPFARSQFALLSPDEQEAALVKRQKQMQVSQALDSQVKDRRAMATAGPENSGHPDPSPLAGYSSSGVPWAQRRPHFDLLSPEDQESQLVLRESQQQAGNALRTQIAQRDAQRWGTASQPEEASEPFLLTLQTSSNDSPTPRRRSGLEIFREPDEVEGRQVERRKKLELGEALRAQMRDRELLRGQEENKELYDPTECRRYSVASSAEALSLQALQTTSAPVNAQRRDLESGGLLSVLRGSSSKEDEQPNVSRRSHSNSSRGSDNGPSPTPFRDLANTSSHRSGLASMGGAPDSADPQWVERADGRYVSWVEFSKLQKQIIKMDTRIGSCEHKEDRADSACMKRLDDMAESQVRLSTLDPIGGGTFRVRTAADPITAC